MYANGAVLGRTYYLMTCMTMLNLLSLERMTELVKLSLEIEPYWEVKDEQETERQETKTA